MNRSGKTQSAPSEDVAKEQGGQPELRIERILKSKVLGRRRVT